MDTLPLRRRRPRTLRQNLAHAAGMTLVGAAVATALLPNGLDLADVNLPGRAGSSLHPAVQAPTDAHLVALMQRYRCSTEGFAGREVPASAIIRRARGTVGVVSFDRGWQVFRDDGPSSLVAVCLRPPG